MTTHGTATHTRVFCAPRELVFRCMLPLSTSPTSGGRLA